MTSHTMCVILAGLVVSGCSKGDGASPTADKNPSKSATDNPTGSVAAPEGCLVGTWSMTEGGVVRSFAFRADGSGEEVYSPQDLRPLRWVIKDSRTVHVTYPPHDDTMQSEADLTFDCAALTFGPAGLYKKK